jgi:hypothetical protein
MEKVTGVAWQALNIRERLPQDSICAQAHITDIPGAIFELMIEYIEMQRPPGPRRARANLVRGISFVLSNHWLKLATAAGSESKVSKTPVSFVMTSRIIKEKKLAACPAQIA